MWAHDFCTVCDKQCAPGSMYCSDSCKMSELSQSSEISSSSGNVYSSLYTTSRHQSLRSPLALCEGPNCTSTNCICGAAVFFEDEGVFDLEDVKKPTNTTDVKNNDSLFIPRNVHQSTMKAYQQEEEPQDYFNYKFSNPYYSPNPMTPELSPTLSACSTSPLSIQNENFLYAPKSNFTTSKTRIDYSPLLAAQQKQPTKQDSSIRLIPDNAIIHTPSSFANTSVNYRRWLSS